MDIDQLIGKFYNRLKKADIAGTEGKVAVQFNLTGKITGVFYIEILNGNVSVMPYEYIDHDAIVSGSVSGWLRCPFSQMIGFIPHSRTTSSFASYPFPHVIETLRELHRCGFVLGMASSRNHCSLDGYVHQMQLEQRII